MNELTLETLPSVITAAELQIFLRISKSSAYNLMNNPKFPTLHIGARKLVMKDDLKKWLEENGAIINLKKENDPHPW